MESLNVGAWFRVRDGSVAVLGEVDVVEVLDLGKHAIRVGVHGHELGPVLWELGHNFAVTRRKFIQKKIYKSRFEKNVSKYKNNFNFYSKIIIYIFFRGETNMVKALEWAERGVTQKRPGQF